MDYKALLSAIAANLGSFKNLAKTLVIRFVLKLGGFWAWAAGIIFSLAWDKIIQPIINYFKVKKEVSDAKKKADKIMDNPNSTGDDVHNAFDDFNKS